MPEDTFESWMEKVNTAFIKATGLSVYDVEDQGYWDMWDGGYSVKDAVNEVMDEVGY
jgi:hypothetical protein